MAQASGIAACFAAAWIKFAKGLGHAVQTQAVELVERWMFEQNQIS